MESNRKGLTGARSALAALAALNFNAVRLLLSKGKDAANDYVMYSHRLYHGYGMPWMWNALPWRSDMRVL